MEKYNLSSYVCKMFDMIYGMFGILFCLVGRRETELPLQRYLLILFIY